MHFVFSNHMKQTIGFLVLHNENIQILGKVMRFPSETHPYKKIQPDHIKMTTYYSFRCKEKKSRFLSKSHLMKNTTGSP